jgi:hypothetical protein
MRVGAAVEIAAIHPVHAATSMHASAAVARSPSAAARSANPNQETVAHLRGGGSCSEHLDRFRLWRCEAYQCCDRYRPTDRPDSFHSVPPQAKRSTENADFFRLP